MAIAPTVPGTAGPSLASRSMARRLVGGDQIAHVFTLIFAASVILITSLLFYELWINSALSRAKFGWAFFYTENWDPIFEQFGARPFIYGTVVTSALALLFAVPLGLGAAIFLAELAPAKISDALTFVIELLAAVPSVIYGLLAVFSLVPILRAIEPYIRGALGWTPFFQ